MNTNDRQNISKVLKLIFAACFMLTISACGSDDDSVAAATTVTDIPQFIQKSALNLTDPNAELLAWITIDDGTRTAMTIDSAAGTVTTSITGLSRSTHTVLLEFEYTDGVDTLILATVSRTVDLTNGDANLKFADTDYSTNFDEDNDGITNVAEIKAGSDPLIPAIPPPATPTTCKLGTSKIGGCVLG